MYFFSRRRPRIIRYIAFFIAIIPLLDLFRSFRLSYPPLHLISRATDLKTTQSVFIASSLWNTGTLLQDYWIPNLLRLADELREANITIFVSIYENGSWDSTKSVLQQLKGTLEGKGISHEIVTDDTTHKEIIAQNVSTGWLKTAYGREMRRIPYLASVRNQALKPLPALTDSGVMFDKLVYINDVVFRPNDVLTLLNTRGGKFASACALDFLNPPWNIVDAKTRGFHPPGIYDDFATRDSNGKIIGSHLYPYFTSKASRESILAGNDVPVQSCWNVAFDAKPFQDPDKPLRFRGIPDSLAQYHLEASECCTIHYDNPLTPSLGVWINPAVRVAYSATAYNAIAAVQSDANPSHWPTASELRWGYWSSKWLWWLQRPGISLSIMKTRYRIGKWQKSHPQEVEPSLSCASDLAMVLTDNGWAMRGADFE
ncbi:MAG: hypothetical protein Q9200_002149 [Gallowayella weberi]